jgi:hypothetical protein
MQLLLESQAAQMKSTSPPNPNRKRDLNLKRKAMLLHQLRSKMIQNRLEPLQEIKNLTRRWMNVSASSRHGHFPRLPSTQESSLPAKWQYTVYFFNFHCA